MITVKEILKQMMRKTKKNKKIAEYRASLKSLEEQRADKVSRMQNILDGAKKEVRALTDEEQKDFEDLEKSIKDIDTSIAMEKRAIELATGSKNRKEEKSEEETRAEERAVAEERAFADYIRGVVTEERADVNLTVTDNGAVIPASIANRIITRITEISPVFQLATRYNVGGTLSIPYYDETTQQITMAYADEFHELESSSGKFDSITLTGFLAGALTKISKKLVNNSNFALVDFVITKMSEAAVRWIEKEILVGTDKKIEGMSGVKQAIKNESATALTSDTLIDVQEEVSDFYQANAIWIMHKETRKAIRKLKDGDGNYLLQRDFHAKWGYTLLGKDVYVSDNMPKIGAGNRIIYYGDMSGVAVKVSEDVNIEVLREKFATQHALGVVCWLELDAKVENQQKLAALEMAAGA